MIRIKADNFFAVDFFQAPDTILVTVSITSTECSLHVTLFIASVQPLSSLFVCSVFSTLNMKGIVIVLGLES